MGMFWCAFYGTRARQFRRQSSLVSHPGHFRLTGLDVATSSHRAARAAPACVIALASARRKTDPASRFILDLLCKSDAKRKRKFKAISVLFTPTLFARARNGARSAASPPRPPVSPRVVRPVTPRPVAPPGAALSAGPRVPGAASAWAPTGRSLSIAHTQKHTRPPPAAAGSKDGRCGP